MAAVEEVAVLYAKNAKGDNDKCSKIRERVFNQALSVPEAFLEHPEHGAQWEYLQREMKILPTRRVREVSLYNQLYTVLRLDETNEYLSKTSYLLPVQYPMM